METNSKKNGEITIPVPWGHVAEIFSEEAGISSAGIFNRHNELYWKDSNSHLVQGIRRQIRLQPKTWGDDRNPLIFCIHGLMDNAGTFNRLITYLPDSFYYVSIDLPCHGRSSSFPPHLPIHTLNYLIVYRIVFNYFKRKFIIMGHSYGGQIGFLFSQIYPECVEKLIMFDTVSIFPISTKNVALYLSKMIDTHINIERKMLVKEQPTYTYEEALEKLWKGRSYAPIGEEGAKALLERAIEPVGDGKYKFTMDQRMKNIVNPLRDFRYIIDGLKLHPVRCPILIVLGTDSVAQQVLFSSLLQLLKSKRNVTIKYANGNHDVHNDNPERVAPCVLEFLSRTRSKM